MPERDYTVFSCDPTGQDRASEVVWLQHRPTKARSEPAAIERVRDSDPDLKANADVEYFAVAGLRPRKMIRQIIEKFSLGYADEDQPAADAQGTLS